MYALLVMNAKNGDLKIIVRLCERQARARVAYLLGSDRRREAFEYLKARGEVEIFLPPGTRLPLTPQITLIEDLL